jgi:cytochrome c peroxidase
MRTLITALVSVSALAAAQPALQEQAKLIFKPLPKQYDSKDNPITKEKVELGRQLYFEKRLSKNHDLSCNSCHVLSKYGVDNEPTSPGHKGQRGSRNSPTVYNAGSHIAQFWDGRAPTLEEQAKGPVLNPVEMAMPDEATVVKVLESIPGYLPMFKKAFPKDARPITYDNMAKAIGAFERTLVTPSRFDKYLAGDEKALTDAEKKGLQTYINTGCTMCHVGENLGAATYQKLGLMKPVPGVKDFGRFDVTKSEADKFFFKVPSLRNVAMTGPYLHDGSLKTLEETVAFMAEYQLNRKLAKEDVDSITTFLKALTGDLPPAAVIAEPKPLPAGKDTPKPDPS